MSHKLAILQQCLEEQCGTASSRVYEISDASTGLTQSDQGLQPQTAVGNYNPPPPLCVKNPPAQCRRAVARACTPMSKIEGPRVFSSFTDSGAGGLSFVAQRFPSSVPNVGMGMYHLFYRLVWVGVYVCIQFNPNPIPMSTLIPPRTCCGRGDRDSGRGTRVGGRGERNGGSGESDGRTDR